MMCKSAPRRVSQIQLFILDCKGDKIQEAQKGRTVITHIEVGKVQSYLVGKLTEKRPLESIRYK